MCWPAWKGVCPMEPEIVLPVDRPLCCHLAGKLESVPDDWKHPARTLADFELMVVTKGTLYMTTLGRDYAVSSGEYLLVPPGERQNGYAASSPEFYWLHFVCRETAQGDAEKNCLRLPAYGTLPKPGRLVVQMKQMQDCMRSYADPVQNDYLCTGVLCELNSQLRAAQSPLKQNAARQIYLDIVDYVKYSVDSNLLVRDIAAYFGYNEKYISHVFSRVAGMPLKQYLLERKLEHAKALLADGNATVAEIAAQCGFHDSCTFLRAFKKAAGCTPSEYRNAYASRLTNRYYDMREKEEKTGGRA